MDETLWPDVGVYGESADMLRTSRALIERFNKQIWSAVDAVVETFRLPQHGVDRTDVRQEAETLVMLYGGLTDKERWGYGELTSWDNGNESETQALLTSHLRRNLLQIVGRKLTNQIDATSIDLLIDEGSEPADEGWEQRMVNRMDRQREAKILRKSYPVFAASIFDDKTQSEIAAQFHITDRTVRNRIASEKRSYLADFISRHGLKVEGDETLEEMTETYRYLNTES